ncbi:MAG: hypothetical protein PVI62_05895, partial [Desulfobacterales bacterium]
MLSNSADLGVRSRLSEFSDKYSHLIAVVRGVMVETPRIYNRDGGCLLSNDSVFSHRLIPSAVFKM